MARETPTAPGRPELLGIHHLKLPVSDLVVSLDFYERALAAVRIPEADHRSHPDGSLYAYILSVPGLGTLLELRLDLVHAPRTHLIDPRHGRRPGPRKPRHVGRRTSRLSRCRTRR